MDARKQLAPIITDTHVPVAVVQSSEGAEAIARKNGTTVADLLRYVTRPYLAADAAALALSTLYCRRLRSGCGVLL